MKSLQVLPIKVVDFCLLKKTYSVSQVAAAFTTEITISTQYEAALVIIIRN